MFLCLLVSPGHTREEEESPGGRRGPESGPFQEIPGEAEVHQPALRAFLWLVVPRLHMSAGFCLCRLLFLRRNSAGRPSNRLLHEAFLLQFRGKQMK